LELTRLLVLQINDCLGDVVEAAHDGIDFAEEHRRFGCLYKAAMYTLKKWQACLALELS
jgi:hypothetical protein